MIIKKPNSIQSSKRIKSVFLSIIYFFILSLTTFHHHPIDFADKIPFYKQQQSGSNSYSYTTENCPIINFANNGFNSFGMSSFHSIIDFVNKNSFFIKVSLYQTLDIYPSNYLRGPPSSLFI